MTPGGETGLGHRPGTTPCKEEYMNTYKILNRNLEVITEGNYRQINSELELNYEYKTYQKKAKSAYNVLNENYFIIKSDMDITDKMREASEAQENIGLDKYAKILQYKNISISNKGKPGHINLGAEKRKIKIAIINEANEIIKTYNSISECGEDTGIGKSNISSYITDGKYHKSKKIKYKFKIIKI